MRTLTAQWTSTCHGCGKPLLKDTEARYDDATKKIYHPPCEPVEGELPTGDADKLADELGFGKVGEIA